MARRVRRPSVTACRSYPQIIAELQQATLISRLSSRPRHSKYGGSSATASLWSGSTTFLPVALLRIRPGVRLRFDGLRHRDSCHEEVRARRNTWRNALSIWVHWLGLFATVTPNTRLKLAARVD